MKDSKLTLKKASPSKTTNSPSNATSKAALVMVLAGFLWGLTHIDTDETNRSDYAPGAFVVYPSQAACAKAPGKTSTECELLATQASVVAEGLNWPFADGASCAVSHGAAACVRGGDGKWRVRMTGFTAIHPGGLSDQKLVIPVFSSGRYPGLYFPNGFPVQYGHNAALGVSEAALGYALTPRSLVQRVCRASPKTALNVVDMLSKKEGYTCYQLHSFITYFREWQLKEVLFAPGRG